MELKKRSSSRILATNPADYENPEKWSVQFEWIMSTSMKMKKSFKKYLQE